jgi:hypothetical protein
MKYDQIKELLEEQFRRLTGVKKATFKKMLGILREADEKKKAKGGRKSKLSVEDQLLMAMEYIREYRTYFHIATNYGISEFVRLLATGKSMTSGFFKESKVRWTKDCCGITDSGYTGIKKLQKNTKLPKKSSKKKPLTTEEKKQNREISSERVVNENVIGSLKRFKIISDRYRNRRKRFGLRFNLIAGIHNLELSQ